MLREGVEGKYKYPKLSSCPEACSSRISEPPPLLCCIRDFEVAGVELLATLWVMYGSVCDFSWGGGFEKIWKTRGQFSVSESYLITGGIRAL